MTTTQVPRTIQDRIESISDKADRVSALTKAADQIQTKRERTQAKNDGFDVLDSRINNVQEQYDQLEKWVVVAEYLDVSVNRSEIRAAAEELDSTIDSFLEKRYHDFHKRADVDDVVQSFDEHRVTLRDHTEEVQQDVQEVANRETQSVNRILSLLQIPDIGTAEDKTVCDNYQYLLEQIRLGNLNSIDLDRLAQHRDDFHSLDIGLGDGLSEEAKDVIWSILENDEVTLSEVSSEVLADLKSFEEFSKRLTVEFTRST